MNLKRIQLNNWMFRLWWIPNPATFPKGMTFHFGLFKIHTFPPEGEAFGKEHYHGFWIQKDFEFRGFAINL